jgi:hypothetical protein
MSLRDIHSAAHSGKENGVTRETDDLRERTERRRNK